VAQAVPEAASHRTGTVLLVEDNPEVAEVATAYLRQLGFTVKPVASAREALDSLGRDPGIDLVLLR